MPDMTPSLIATSFSREAATSLTKSFLHHWLLERRGCASSSPSFLDNAVQKCGDNLSSDDDLGSSSEWEAAVTGPVAMHPQVRNSPSGIISVVWELRQSVQYHFRVETGRLLFDKVAALAERFSATSSYLFTLRPNGILESVIVRRASAPKDTNTISMPFWGNGIVPFVARTRQSLCVGDVQSCSFYEPSLVTTQSELAIPLSDPSNPDQLLGVLNFESDQLNKFDGVAVDSCAAMILEICLQLKCYLRLESNGADMWPWNPEINRSWTLRRSLARICEHVSRCISNDGFVSCSIWNVDWSKSCLNVEATHGYDYSFIADRTLPINSFLGDAAGLNAEGVIYDTPQRATFVEKQRACDEGLRAVSAAPLFFPLDNANASLAQGRAFAVLAVYSFRGRTVPLLPYRDDLIQLARFLSGVRSEFESFRMELAVATLLGRLQCASPGGRFDVLRDTLCEVLDSAACTVFVCPVTGNEILYVSTTGLLPEAAQLRTQFNIHRIGSYEPVVLYKSDSTGLVPFLARSPGRTLRLYDVGERLGADDGIRLPPVDRRYIDAIARDDEHCRFLGVSVGTGEVSHGVIRLLRAAGQPPFSTFDEALLRALASAVKGMFEEVAICSWNEGVTVSLPLSP